VVSLGGFSTGVFTLGGFSLGLLGACGGFAVAPLGLAIGGMSLGLVAVGGMAIGGVAVSGAGLGWYGWGAPASMKAMHFLPELRRARHRSRRREGLQSTHLAVGSHHRQRDLPCGRVVLHRLRNDRDRVGLARIIVWQRREEEESRLSPLSPPTSRSGE
jgi:hypothetical protein